MDLVGGALPNVMFLAGIIAIGIGLGLQFKMLPVEGELGKGARFGAVGVGIALIAASVALYIRPPSTATSDMPTVAADTQAVVGGVSAPAENAVQTNSVSPTAAPPAPTDAPQLVVPDITSQSVEQATALLKAQGLVIGEAKDSCTAIGAKEPAKAKKDKIACQSPAAGSQVAPNTSITYVLANGKH